MATGGVLLGGGIAPKILEKMKSENFMESCLATSFLLRPVESYLQNPLREALPF